MRGNDFLISKYPGVCGLFDFLLAHTGAGYAYSEWIGQFIIPCSEKSRLAGANEDI
jgi:hypothetical protein